MRDDQLHNRFSNLVPPETREMGVMVIGAGMTGSWTTLALARMVRIVRLFDFDTVEPENCGVQAYNELHLGENKATATAEMAFGLPVEAFNRRFEPSDITDYVPHVTVACVDSIASRRLIAEALIERVMDRHFFIDTRVLGETAFIYAMPATFDALDAYLDSLPEGDDLVHAPCGAKGTAFAGMWVASQVAALVNRIGRGVSLPEPIVWHVGMNERIG